VDVSIVTFVARDLQRFNISTYGHRINNLISHAHTTLEEGFHKAGMQMVQPLGEFTSAVNVDQLFLRSHTGGDFGFL
jgi:hypothetical protein